jgi:type I restriction enzyme S subunit
VVVPGRKCQPDARSTLPFIGLDSIEPQSTTLASVIPFATMKSIANCFHPGQVLYSRLRPYLNKVWLADREGACSGEFIVMTPRDDISSAYLQWLLHHQHFVAFASHAVAGDRPRIDFATMAKYAVPIPPIDTQRRIVARIDELFAELDDGEAALARARADLETYRKSLLKAAVTGELTADWRAANPPQETGDQLLQRILADRKARWEAIPKNRGKRYKDPMPPAAGPTSPLPAGWAWATLDQLGAVENGQTPRGVDAVTQARGDFPWYKVSSMNLPGNERVLSPSQWWVSADDAKAVGLTIRPKGTIVFPKRGGAIMTNKKRLLGRDGAFDLNVMGYVPAPTHKDFCWTIFQNIDLAMICDGSNVPQINFPDIAKIEIAVPPDAEGTLIGQLANDALADAEDAKVAYDDMQTQSSQLRQSILNAAFRGDLIQ